MPDRAFPHWLRLILAFGLALLVFWLDWQTKQLAEVNIPYGSLNYVLPVLDLTLLYNTGAAFSFLGDAGGWQRYFFIAISSAVSIGLVIWIVFQSRLLEQLASALILAGAVGNLHDRVLYGHVIDFIAVHWNQHYWPAFNVADSAITVGAGLLLLDWLVLHRNTSEDK